MSTRTKIKGALMAAGVAASLGVADVSTARAEDVTLTMAVPDWPPTRVMKKFFDEQYKPKSGNTVKLDVDFIPGDSLDNCDFKNTTQDGCTNLEQETKNLGKALDKTGTYKTQICVDVYFDKVDRTKIVGGREVDVPEARRISIGCFDYTVSL